MARRCPRAPSAEKPAPTHARAPLFGRTTLPLTLASSTALQAAAPAHRCCTARPAAPQQRTEPDSEATRHRARRGYKVGTCIRSTGAAIRELHIGARMGTSIYQRPRRECVHSQRRRALLCATRTHPLAPRQRHTNARTHKRTRGCAGGMRRSGRRGSFHLQLERVHLRKVRAHASLPLARRDPRPLCGPGRRV